MLDEISFSTLQGDRSAEADFVTSFVQYLEKKLGARFLYDARDVPFGKPDLARQFDLAKSLTEAGVIKEFGPSSSFDDDPPIKLWSAAGASKHEARAGGISSESDADALTGALAEALERYLWREMDDYAPRIKASVSEMKRGKKNFAPPERFAGYSSAQRRDNSGRAFDDETPFVWTKGRSLVSGKPIFVPSQTVSGKHLDYAEPSIRNINTTGLATWPNQIGARLRGMLECIERDAYMIMWLNQLTLPRLKLGSFPSENTSLLRLLRKCEQYRMRVHIVELLTDAPAYALMAVIEDQSDEAPRFSIGLKTGGNLAYTIEKAILEALRGHRAGRRYATQSQWNDDMPINEVGHYERTHYWTSREHVRHLEFLIAGKEKDVELKPWENETEEAHLRRVVGWCRDNNYECISVALTRSKKNPTPLHIEMVVIPELQWMHLCEKDFMLGGERWKEIPEKFGLHTRKEMFRDRPHPFA